MTYYTGQGDQGKTQLVGGHTVDKDSLRVNCYGTVDEINSYVGLLDAYLPSEFLDVKEDFTISNRTYSTVRVIYLL